MAIGKDPFQHRWEPEDAALKRARDGHAKAELFREIFMKLVMDHAIPPEEAENRALNAIEILEKHEYKASIR